MVAGFEVLPRPAPKIRSLLRGGHGCCGSLGGGVGAAGARLPGGPGECGALQRLPRRLRRAPGLALGSAAAAPARAAELAAHQQHPVCGGVSLSAALELGAAAAGRRQRDRLQCSHCSLRGRAAALSCLEPACGAPANLPGAGRDLVHLSAGSRSHVDGGAAPGRAGARGAAAGPGVLWRCGECVRAGGAVAGSGAAAGGDPKAKLSTRRCHLQQRHQRVQRGRCHAEFTVILQAAV